MSVSSIWPLPARSTSTLCSLHSAPRHPLPSRIIPIPAQNSLCYKFGSLISWCLKCHQILTNGAGFCHEINHIFPRLARSAAVLKEKTTFLCPQFTKFTIMIQNPGLRPRSMGCDSTLANGQVNGDRHLEEYRAIGRALPLLNQHDLCFYPQGTGKASWFGHLSLLQTWAQYSTWALTIQQLTPFVAGFRSLGKGHVCSHHGANRYLLLSFSNCLEIGQV